MEAYELENPSPRKIDGERVVHTSPVILFPPDVEGTVLCDFGEARLGDKANNESPAVKIQPLEYRAPEVILQAPYSYSVDIWNAGLLVSGCFVVSTLR